MLFDSTMPAPKNLFMKNAKSEWGKEIYTVRTNCDLSLLLSLYQWVEVKKFQSFLIFQITTNSKTCPYNSTKITRGIFECGRIEGKSEIKTIGSSMRI